MINVCFDFPDEEDAEQLLGLCLQAQKEYPGFPDFDAIIVCCMFDSEEFTE